MGELATLRNQLVASVNMVEPEVVMPIPVINKYPSLHHMGGDFTAVQVTVPAKVLIDAYDSYRSEIFRYNPRGPLGSNKVNKEIQRTLEDPVLKRHFHLLNNGLTAICDSLEYKEDRQELEIKNFQVVNGCQTVFNLHLLREHISDEVKVSVRIVEGLQATWGAGEISKASNYQTAVKPEQLASLGPEHDAISEHFEKLQPPWFYEKQKGYKRFLSATDKRLYNQRYGNRIISTSDLGQYVAAFLGNPILAKYDPQRLFERSDLEGDGLYRAVFVEDNHAAQLVLPVLVGRRVRQAVKERIGS